MEIREYVAALRKAWMVIVACVVAGTAVGYWYAGTITPTYRSTAKVFVSLQRGDTVSELVQGSTYTQNLIASYALLAREPVVLDPVISELGLDMSPKALAGRITTSTPINTVVIAISATSVDPAMAQDIANAVSAHLTDAIDDVSPKDAAGTSSVAVAEISPASRPTVPFQPNTRLWLMTGFVGGIGVGLAAALLLALLDTKVRTPGEIGRLTGLALLGSVSRLPRGRRRSPQMHADPDSTHAEAYRKLRTNLQYLDVDAPARVIAVTSAGTNEGKTTTAVNLALAVAESDVRVLLLDADLRRPAVATTCGLDGTAGLTSVLVGKATLTDVVQPWGSARLDVLTSGSIPPNPGQLLGSLAMRELLAEAKSAYDLVIVDAAPLLPVADTGILAPHVDGIIVVAACRKVHRDHLVETVTALRGTGANVIGAVATMVKRSRRSSTYGYSAREVRAGAGAVTVAPEDGPVTDLPAPTGRGAHRADHLTGKLDTVPTPAAPVGAISAADGLSADEVAVVAAALSAWQAEHPGEPSPTEVSSSTDDTADDAEVHVGSELAADDHAEHANGRAPANPR